MGQKEVHGDKLSITDKEGAHDTRGTADVIKGFNKQDALRVAPLRRETISNRRLQADYLLLTLVYNDIDQSNVFLDATSIASRNLTPESLSCRLCAKPRSSWALYCVSKTSWISYPVPISTYFVVVSRYYRSHGGRRSSNHLERQPGQRPPPAYFSHSVKKVHVFNGVQFIYFV